MLCKTATQPYHKDTVFSVDRVSKTSKTKTKPFNDCVWSKSVRFCIRLTNLYHIDVYAVEQPLHLVLLTCFSTLLCRTVDVVLKDKLYCGTL